MTETPSREELVEARKNYKSRPGGRGKRTKPGPKTYERLHELMVVSSELSYDELMTQLGREKLKHIPRDEYDLKKSILTAVAQTLYSESENLFFTPTDKFKELFKDRRDSFR